MNLTSDKPDSENTHNYSSFYDQRLFMTSAINICKMYGVKRRLNSFAGAYCNTNAL